MEKNKVLVIIPARSGSKGFVNKNISLFNGEPLLVRAVKQALRIFSPNQIFVSTDSTEYKRLIESEAGLFIPELRPYYISGDLSTNDEYIEHAINLYNKNLYFFTHVLILQPTSPLRTDSDIEESIKHKLNTSEMLASVFEAKSNPYYLHRLKDVNGKIIPLLSNSATRRQDVPKVYELNGAIFFFSIKDFVNNNKSMRFNSVIPFEMKWNRSIDIDDEIDLKIAELIYSIS
jgi:N-acylneuraminate cytidylyltransferase